MFSLFKKSISSKELANIIWEGIVEWPIKYGEKLKKSFEDIFDKDINIVFDEMIYFLGFSADYALSCFFNNNKSKVINDVRDNLMSHISDHAKKHNCQALPKGEWLGEGLIWTPLEKGSKMVGNSTTNLNERFNLYAQAIKRIGPDKSVSQALSYLLASWCGTTDISFILFATEISMGEFEFVKIISKKFVTKD